MLIFLICERRLSPGILAVSEPYQTANYSTLGGSDNASDASAKSSTRTHGDKIVSSLKEGFIHPDWTTAEQTI